MQTIDRRRFLALSMMTTTAVLAPPAFAGLSRVSMDKAGNAIQGYDTAAYWSVDAARPGLEDHVVEWKGASWRFGTAQEAAQFAAAPETLAPKFGGFCTRAMSLKKVVDGDPEVWRIFEGSLYLFARPVGRRYFDRGEAAMIAKAQTHWDTLS